MITLDAERAGEILGTGVLRSPVTGVSIDTRTLRAGDLFVALRGERFDGHDYVEAALAAGASGAVVEKAAWQERAAGLKDAPPVYQVDDTLVALGALAREVRRLSGATVFAITGSAGKTSTKDILKSMVGRVRRVVATSGNQNNEVGVPLTLLQCSPETEAVVVEMGMRGLGQIAELASIAEPDVGIITNVHPVHLELLGSLDNVAKAKAEVIAGVKSGGTAIVPAGCAPLEPLLNGCVCRLVRFGIRTLHPKEGADTHRGRLADFEGWLESDGRGGHVWVVRWSGGEARTSVDHMPKHALENATAAAAACWAAGLPVAECLAGIIDVELSDGRGQTAEAGGLCVIDDTYNANPAAMRAAIDELARLAAERGGRAVAVLGDMLEMGKESAQYHTEIGRHAAAAGVAALWGVGPMSTAMVEGFASWWQEHAQTGREWSAAHLDSCEEADAVIAGLRRGDIVLVKGSRGVQLEKVVIRVLSEAREGRWGGGNEHVSVDDDSTGEKRHCYR